MKAQPPKRPAREVFEKLIEWPRPVSPIEFRFAGTRDDLFVRALRSSELKRCTTPIRLVAAVLCDESGAPVFASAAQAGDAILDDTELVSVTEAVKGELSAICPVFGVIDMTAWLNYLEQGAAASGHTTFALSTCVDVAMGMQEIRSTPRPDRYFGCSTRDLLDGHWLAFFAARRVISKLQS